MEDEGEEEGGEEGDGMWEEKFKTHTDSKPYGTTLSTPTV